MTDADLDRIHHMLRDIQGDLRTVRDDIMSMRRQAASHDQIRALTDRFAEFEARLDSRLDEILAK